MLKYCIEKTQGEMALQTIILNVSDDYVLKLSALLEILPKNKVKNIREASKKDTIKKIAH